VVAKVTRNASLCFPLKGPPTGPLPLHITWQYPFVGVGFILDGALIASPSFITQPRANTANFFDPRRFLLSYSIATPIEWLDVYSLFSLLRSFRFVLPNVRRLLSVLVHPRKDEIISQNNRSLFLFGSRHTVCGVFFFSLGGGCS